MVETIRKHTFILSEAFKHHIKGMGRQLCPGCECNPVICHLSDIRLTSFVQTQVSDVVLVGKVKLTFESSLGCLINLAARGSGRNTNDKLTGLNSHEDNT